jgi:hypothetical protein
MSKYKIDDVVLSKFGIDEKLEKFKVINVRYVDEYKLNDIISFRYEWNNKEKIYEDPYVYDLELYCDKNNEIYEDEYKIFKEKKDQLTSQIVELNN